MTQKFTQQKNEVEAFCFGIDVSLWKGTCVFTSIRIPCFRKNAYTCFFEFGKYVVNGKIGGFFLVQICTDFHGLSFGTQSKQVPVEPERRV